MADPDYSGFANWQDVTPGQTAQKSAAPTTGTDELMRTLEPHDYAYVSSQKSIQQLHAQGLRPDVGVGQQLYQKALDDAVGYRKDVLTQQAKTALELQKERGEVATDPVLSQLAGGPMSIKRAQAETEAEVQRETEQLKQGPGAARQAQAQTAAGLRGQVIKLPQTVSDEIGQYSNGYQSVADLQDAWQNVFHNKQGAPYIGEKDNTPGSAPPGVGGYWKSLGGRSEYFAFNTSPEFRNYQRELANAEIPIARAVLAEKGMAPTKENIMEQTKQITLPGVIDSESGGNNAFFNMKKHIYDRLLQLKNQYGASGGYDMSEINNGLATYGADFHSDKTQQWDPIKGSHSVDLGTSLVADHVINNLNANANKGIPPSAIPSQFQGQAQGWPKPQTIDQTQGAQAPPGVPSQFAPGAPSLAFSGGGLVQTPSVSSPGYATPEAMQTAAMQQRAQMYGSGPGQALPTPPPGNPMLTLAQTYGERMKAPAPTYGSAAGNPPLTMGSGQVKAPAQDPVGWLLSLMPQWQPLNR